MELKIDCNISKLDVEKQIVYGWASVVEKDGEPVIDLQGDIISVEELEKAAHNFVVNCRVAGEMHIEKGVGHLVESLVFTKELQAALDIDLKKVGWFVGFKVTKDSVWEKVKSGEFSMFSIGGRGTRQNA